MNIKEKIYLLKTLNETNERFFVRDVNTEIIKLVRTINQLIKQDLNKSDLLESDKVTCKKELLDIAKNMFALWI